MKKIVIHWGDPEGQTVTGLVNVYEGPQVVEMVVTAELMITAGPGDDLALFPVKGKRFIPELSKDDHEVLAAMVRAYYRGLMNKRDIWTWRKLH